MYIGKEKANRDLKAFDITGNVRKQRVGNKGFEGACSNYDRGKCLVWGLPLKRSTSIAQAQIHLVTSSSWPEN